MAKPKVSVIVPTKNSSATLDECLQSITTQTYDQDNLEIVVVDNFSSDTTPEIAKKYTKQFYSQGPERSAQRNYAAKKANGDYLLVIDSDMKLSAEVIEQCVQQIESKGVSGIIIPEESFGKGFWAQCKKLERSFYVGISYMEAARFFMKMDFLDLGGYDEAMVSGEDWDLSQRIEAKGKLGHTKAFIYHNEGHISLIKTIRKKFYYAKQFASYTQKSTSTQNVTQQTSIVGRYRLFLSHPVRLFKNPVLGIGMLFMKTCEFGFGGLGYLAARKKTS